MADMENVDDAMGTFAKVPDWSEAVDKGVADAQPKKKKSTTPKRTKSPARGEGIGTAAQKGFLNAVNKAKDEQDGPERIGYIRRLRAIASEWPGQYAMPKGYEKMSLDALKDEFELAFSMINSDFSYNTGKFVLEKIVIPGTIMADEIVNKKKDRLRYLPRLVEANYKKVLEDPMKKLIIYYGIFQPSNPLWGMLQAYAGLVYAASKMSEFSTDDIDPSSFNNPDFNDL